MAFTKTPTQDTYDTKRFPLVGMPMQRNGTDALKDQRLLNCYAEQIKAQVTEAKKYFVKKRWGLTAVLSPGSGVSRGCIYEPTTNRIFFVVGPNLYTYDGITTTLMSSSIPDSPNSVGFTTHLTSAVSVVLLTGTAGYVINPVAVTFTQIVDADFPNPHIPYPISMDGYLFVAKKFTADIYNSDLDDPMSWTPGNFITAEMYPDYITAMTKNNNYVIAVGQGSMEFFYDLGTVSGSPLQRNESAVQQFGTPAPDSVIQTENQVFLVGSTGNGGRTVWMVEGFKAEDIGTEAVRNALNDVGTNIGQVNGYCLRVDGHKLMVWRLPSTNRTFVYDQDSKLWAEWSTTSGVDQVVFTGKYACDSALGFPYLMTDATNGVIVTMNDTAYQDLSATIKMQFTTLKLDFENMNRKVCSRLAVFGDWPLNTTSSITVEWSDDDYRTWSTPRTIQLSVDYSWTRNCGRFRRRALRFTHVDATPLRLEGCEMNIDLGVS